MGRSFMNRIGSAAVYIAFLIGAIGCKTVTPPDIPAPPAATPMAGETRMVPPSDPMWAAARIRGVIWPLVYNDGPVYPPQTGICSYYHEPQRIATGEYFNPEALTAAHKSLPFGTIVRCTRTDTGRSVVVVINDRGPYVDGRIIDLSRRAAQHIGMIGDGIAPCRLDILAYPVIDTMGPKGNG